MIKRVNRCDIFILTTVLYYLQDVLYPSGIINQILQLIIILWGLVSTAKVFIYRGFKLPPLAATYVLCFMFVVYGAFLLLFGNFNHTYIPGAPPKYIYLQVSLRSLLPIFVFYRYSVKGLLTEKRILVYTILLVFVNILRFYEAQQNSILEFGTDKITNNMGYVFTSAMPLLLFFYKKPVLQYVLLSIIMLFVFLAMKRGAIFIAAVCCVLIIVYHYKIYDSLRSRIISLICIILLTVLTTSFIQSNLQNNDFFNKRLEQTLDGDSSDRDILYSNIIDATTSEQNLLIFLFGRGADSTFAVAGDYAHNDWLETWCNNGIVGVIILFVFFITIYKDTRVAKKKFIYPLYLSYLLLFIVLVSKTMFSMSIQNLEPAQTLLLGYFIYLNHTN